MGRIIMLMAAAAYASPALGHGVYDGVREKLDPSRTLCCGEDDCEALTNEQIRVGPGEVAIFSTRFRAWISVGLPKVGWMDLPKDTLGHPGHWCGRERATSEFHPGDIQIDARFHTYCLFLRPSDM